MWASNVDPLVVVVQSLSVSPIIVLWSIKGSADEIRAQKLVTVGRSSAREGSFAQLGLLG